MTPSGDADSPGLLATAIRRPVTVTSLVILVTLFGLLSLFGLPVQLAPDITTPTITVTTVWPGASPLEVESEIVEPQERVLKRVQGLERMEVLATSNRAEVTLEFDVGTDLDQALVRVSNQLSQVPTYPPTADEPVVSTANASGPPLAVLLVRHPEGKSVAAYQSWVVEEIIPQIERVPGVASIFMRGGRESEVQIDFDTAALAARKLTVAAVADRVQRELANVSAGELDVGKRSMLVRTMAAPERVEAFARLVVGSGVDGTPVMLSDVAKVGIGLRRATDFAIGDDREAIAILPRREAGSNVLEVTEELKQVVERLNRTRFAPEGLELEVVDDQSGYIKGSLAQVRQNLALGGVLAVVVLLLFLGSVKASALVALAIPVCLLGTALGMYLLGRTVNVVSLAGVTFAVGMVIDNSIVVLEAIETRRRSAATAAGAALDGVREVWGAVLASTATTAAVFIPILTWSGEVGELLRDAAYAMAISVALSLLVSVLVIPSLSARWLSVGKSAGTHLAGRLATWGARLRDAVAGQVRSLVSRRGLSALVVLGTVLTSVLITLSLLPKMEYLPQGNRNLIFGIVLPAPGLSVEELIQTGYVNQATMKKHTGQRVGDVPSVRRSFFVGDGSRLFIGGVAEDPDEVRKLRDFMRGLHAQIPGAIGFASQASLFASGLGEGRAVKVELSGSDMTELITTGRSLFGQLRGVVPGAQIRPVPMLDLGAPELRVLPERSKLSALRLTPRDVSLVADAYVDGARIGLFGEEGERKLDVVLRANANTIVSDETSLASAPVVTHDGVVVPLSAVAEVTTALGPTAVQRIERRRAVTLQVTPPDEYPIETAIDSISEHLEKMRASGALPASVDVELGGSAGKLVAAQKQFGWVLLIALLISYLLLASLFEDFVAPIVVLISVPLATAGGVTLLRAVDKAMAPQPLDLMTALGFLILMGVVVNNAILIVDGAITRLRDGEELETAVTESVRRRVRPIFMSTFTSLAGLAPMVLLTGDGSELYRGVGSIVLGGLAVSMFLVIYVVPSFFTLVWRLRRA